MPSYRPKGTLSLDQLARRVCDAHEISLELVCSVSRQRRLTPIRIEIARYALEQRIATLKEVAHRWEEIPLRSASYSPDTASDELINTPDSLIPVPGSPSGTGVSFSEELKSCHYACVVIRCVFATSLRNSHNSFGCNGSCCRTRQTQRQSCEGYVARL